MAVVEGFLIYGLFSVIGLKPKILKKPINLTLQRCTGQDEAEWPDSSHEHVGGAVVGAALGAPAEGPGVAVGQVLARLAAVGGAIDRLRGGVGVDVEHQRVARHVLLRATHTLIRLAPPEGCLFPHPAAQHIQSGTLPFHLHHTDIVCPDTPHGFQSLQVIGTRSTPPTAMV